MQGNVFVVTCKRIGRRKAYHLYFQFNNQLVEKIKNLPQDQRKWKGIERAWEVKLVGLIDLIEQYKGSKLIHFDFGDSRGVFINQLKKHKEDEAEKMRLIEDLKMKKDHWIKWKAELEKNYEQYSEKLHANLKEGIKLYPHQIVAGMYLNEVRNALISHEMGLGKTLASIAYVEMNPYEKVLVVTPNSLKFNYYYEVDKFTKGAKAHVVNWNKNIYSTEEAKYVIVNYEYFNPSDKNRMKQKWSALKIDVLDVVICDESHRLKNSDSNTYKNFKKYLGDVNLYRNSNVSKVFMTGTPAPNRAYELYTVLNQISPLDFPTKQYFYEYYCGLKYDLEEGWGWDSVGESHLDELYHKIAPYTHRKRKKEVLKDLPDKIYQLVPLEMSMKDMGIYEKIEEGELNDFLVKETSNPLTIMLRLRQFTSHLKTKHVIDLIENVIDTGEKIVIVDMFKETLIALKEKYGDIAGLHTGDQSVEHRADIVREFQDPDSKMKIFLGSIQTCNYGLTLTAASKMFIISLPYVPGEFDQVADRCILKGELVLTKNGYIPIESVEVSDYVLSHKGNWCRVVNTKSKIERNKSFYDIKYKGFYKPLRCTFDHKIYVYDKVKGTYCWEKASELDIFKHYMVFPKFNVKNYKDEFKVRVFESKAHNKKNININPVLSNDLLYAFGRYVGDGHTNDHQISICGHIDEYEEVLYSMNSINNEFNISGITEYKGDNKIEMYISSKELRNNFKEWFGDGAYNKKVPDFIFHMSDDKIRSFLNGYYGADGYNRKNTQQATTVSNFLTFQLVILEALLGNSPTLRFNDAASSWSFEYSIKDKIKRDSLIINDDGNVLFPIQEIKQYKPKRNDERVYDLEVEDDHSFVVGLSSVHNCHRIGQKNVVNIYVFAFPDTIDDIVYSCIETKRKEIVKVIDNEDYTSNIEESVLTEVINKIKEKHGR